MEFALTCLLCMVLLFGALQIVYYLLCLRLVGFTVICLSVLQLTCNGLCYCFVVFHWNDAYLFGWLVILVIFIAAWVDC